MNILDMPTYTCEKCARTFSQKGHYTAHLNKKIDCATKTAIKELAQKIVDDEKDVAPKKPVLMEDFMKSIPVDNSYWLNPCSDDIFRLMVEKENIISPSVKYYFNKEITTDDRLHQSFIDVIQFPPTGARVFFVSYKKENENIVEEEKEVTITYLPKCMFFYHKIKVVFDNPKVLIKGYTLQKEERNMLIYLCANNVPVQDNNILFEKGTYRLMN